MKQSFLNFSVAAFMGHLSLSKHWFARGGHLGSLSLDMQRSAGSSMDHEEQPVLVDEDRTDEVCSPLIIFPFAEFINRLQG